MSIYIREFSSDHLMKGAATEFRAIQAQHLQIIQKRLNNETGNKI